MSENLEFRLREWCDEEIKDKFTSLPKNAQKIICKGAAMSNDILSNYSKLLSGSKEDRLKIYQLCHNLIDNCLSLQEEDMIKYLGSIKKIASRTFHEDDFNILREANELYIRMAGRKN